MNNIDTNGRAVAVVLVRLNKIEVTAIAFRKSVVSVKLKLARGNWVVTTVKNICAISKTAKHVVSLSQVSIALKINTTCVKTGLNSLTKTTTEGINSSSSSNATVVRTSQSVTKRASRGAGESRGVKGISVVKPLVTTNSRGGFFGDMSIRLNNPYKFLDRVVKVQFDFVSSRRNGFITGEL